MPVPPVGLMYISAFLGKNGFESEILDAYHQNLDIESTIEEIKNKEPDVLGVSCLTSNSANVFYLVQKLRLQLPSLKIILGNIHASIFSSFFLRKAGADFVVHGEGEEPMLKILQNLAHKNNEFSTIPNISYKINGEIKNTNLEKPSITLDDLPWPARDKIPFLDYTSGVYGVSDKREYDMVFASRGCIFKCTFCCINKHHVYRYRSAVDVVNEIEHVVNEYSLKAFAFGDSLFTINPKRVIEICDEIIRRKINAPWFCEGHANTVNPEMLEKMREAGCDEIAFGVETGNPGILKQIGKRTTHEKIRNAVRMAKNTGIRTSGLFMFGFPGETESEMMETIEFSLSTPFDRAQFAITTPYPGTALYDKLIADGKLKLRDEDDPKYVEDWYKYSQYASYTDNSSIWVPDGLTSERMKEIQKLALRKFYLRPKQIISELRKIKLNDLTHLKSFIMAAKDTFI